MWWNTSYLGLQPRRLCKVSWTFTIRHSPFNGKYQSLTFDVWSYLAIRKQMFIILREEIVMDFLGGFADDIEILDIIIHHIHPPWADIIGAQCMQIMFYVMPQDHVCKLELKVSFNSLGLGDMVVILKIQIWSSLWCHRNSLMWS